MTEQTSVARGIPPALFFPLYLPFGSVTGFIAVTLQYCYVNDAHVPLAAFYPLVSLALAPHAFKVLWAPLVDTLFNVKGWYVAAVLGIGGSLAAMGFLPAQTSSLPALTVLALISSLSATFAGQAAESLMAHGTNPANRGAAGGFSQAGNVGAASLSGGAGLLLAHGFHSLTIASCLIGGVCLVSGLSVLGVGPAPKRVIGASPLGTMWQVLKDCWQVGWSRPGLLTLFVFILPLGSGGAAALFSGICKGWGVSAGTIAGLATVNGVVVAGAALAGGWISDRMDRRTAYCLAGVLGGLVAAGMAFAPHTPVWFVTLAFAYTAALGLSYAAYAAVTLETIGAGAAATKWNLFASASNVPVVLMVAVDGGLVTRFGADGMLWGECALALGAAALYGVVALAFGRPTRPLSAPAPTLVA